MGRGGAKTAAICHECRFYPFVHTRKQYDKVYLIRRMLLKFQFFLVQGGSEYTLYLPLEIPLDISLNLDRQKHCRKR